jgi:hypothetical protein
MPKKKKKPDEREDGPAGKIGAPACDLQRIDNAAKWLNSEAADVLDYQSSGE